MENTQVRFANISIKVSDEFMFAVGEQRKYNDDTYLVYLKKDKKSNQQIKQKNKEHCFFQKNE